MVKPLTAGIALAGVMLLGTSATASAAAIDSADSTAASTQALQANIGVIITIGTDPGVCLPYSDCFTTDQGFYVNVYDTTASANQGDCPPWQACLRHPIVG